MGRCSASALLLVALTGCAFESPELDPGLRCGQDGRCPGGQRCLAGWCVAPVDDELIDAASSEVVDGGIETSLDATMPDAGDPGCTATVCPGATLVDDFAAGGIPPLWFSWSSPTACTISEVDGTLRMSFPGTTTSLFCGIDAEAHYDVRSSAIFVDAAGAADASSFSTFFQLSTPGDFSTRVEIFREQGSLVGRQLVGGTASPTRTITYSASAHRYWRIRGDAGRVYFETSANATTWTPWFDAAAQVELSEVVVTLGSGHYMNPGAPMVSSFGGVNVP